MPNELVEATAIDVPARATQIDMTVGPDHASLVPQNLGEVVGFAQLMSRAGAAVPKHLRGEPGACLAVAMRAFHLGMEPFALADKTYFVNDRMAFEAQAVAAIVLSRVNRKGMPRYSYHGEALKRRCLVEITMPDGEVVPWESPEIGGISPKNSPLWKSDPDQQLGYYSIRGWARRHRPDVIMGIYDREEAAAMAPDDRATSFEALEARAETEEPKAAGSGNAAAAKNAAPVAARPTPASADDSPGDRPAADVTTAPAESEPASLVSEPSTETDAGPQDTGDDTGQPAGELALEPETVTEPDSTDDGPQDHQIEESLSASAPAPDVGGFGECANAIAEAKDWPSIDAALMALRRSEAWIAASKATPDDLIRQAMIRRIAYVRLKELTDGGYRFDFVNDLQAWRCYIEWEEDLDALTGNRSAVHASQAWRAMDGRSDGTQAKLMLDRAYDARVVAIKAAAKASEFA